MSKQKLGVWKYNMFSKIKIHIIYILDVFVIFHAFVSK